MATEGLVERKRLSDRERQVLEHLEARADSIPAKANGLEPHAYFSHLFAELPKATAVDHFIASMRGRFFMFPRSRTYVILFSRP